MFRAYWLMGTPQRTAMDVIYWSGARCFDAVNLGTLWVRDDWVTFTLSKTGGPASCPVDTLPEWCRGLATDHSYFVVCLPSDRLQWIVTEFGKPCSIKGLSQLMSRIAAEAGGLSRNRSNHPRNRCMDGAMQALLTKLITPEQLTKSVF